MQHPVLSFVWMMSVVVTPSAASANDPSVTPTAPPTPRPRSLSDYARGVRLDEEARSTGPTVISNHTVRQLADRGMLTVPGSTGASAPLPTPSPVDEAVRRRWQKAYAARHAVVVRLQARKSELEVEREELARAPLTARILAREEALRDERERLDAQLAAARDALARVVHRARQDGAQPGWFRGL